MVLPLASFGEREVRKSLQAKVESFCVVAIRQLYIFLTWAMKIHGAKKAAVRASGGGDATAAAGKGF